jgi:hypothetical protein
MKEGMNMKPIIIKSTYPNWIAATIIGIAFFCVSVWLASLTGCGHVEKIIDNAKVITGSAMSVIDPPQKYVVRVKDNYGSEYTFRVWHDEQDSVRTDLPQLERHGSRWWGCFAHCFDVCAGHNDCSDGWMRCINSCVAGCEIGDLIVSVCDIFPDRQQ